MQLVLVEWQDSRQADGAWRWRDELAPPTPVLCRSVGWRVSETDEALLLAQSLGDVQGERMQIGGTVEIARRQVVRVKALACPSWARVLSDPELA